jgi:hypothetical protein
MPEPLEMTESMPPSKSRKMKRIEFVVPEPLLEQSLEMATDEGLAEAEMHRLFWILGRAAYAEMSNKSLTNQKLRYRIAKFEETGELPDGKED